MTTKSEHGRHDRIILLLDMDCFYAQCETIRLGLDRSMPLCLMQWNSALAVNYPARDFGIKRGATIEEIRQMSGGHCVTLHLPIISAVDQNCGDAHLNPEAKHPIHLAATNVDTDGIGGNADASIDSSQTTSGSSSATKHNDDSSVQTAYDREFNLPQPVRDTLFAAEKHKIRHQSEGKASLERYRLASARIFQVIMEALVTHIGKGNFVFERASIDELFLDVTSHCYDTSLPAWQRTSFTKSDHDTTNDRSTTRTNHTSDEETTESNIPETVICANTKIHIAPDEEFYALRRGCLVARGIRKAVFDTLGFTLSAGVSTSKMVAKLGASYGKPAGQAVILPNAIPHVMDETKIKKVRNLGGKFGREVQKLLPSNEDTMGSIARLLSLPVLCKSLGMQSGKMVFDACRGINDEPVKETRGTLAKSVTAYKSFGEADHAALQKWISVLTTDVINRINVDKERNNRYPTTCVIQYYWKNDACSETKGASMRIPFPSKSPNLLIKVQEILKTKAKIKICRLGISAVGFEHRPNNGGIMSFLQKREDTNTLTPSRTTESDNTPNINVQAKKLSVKKSQDTSVLFQDNLKNTSIHLHQTDKSHETFHNDKASTNETSTILEKVENMELPVVFPPPLAMKEQLSVRNDTIVQTPNTQLSKFNGVETDLKLAKKLQASFERENYIYEQSARIKRAKIDHFFKKKKT